MASPFSSKFGVIQIFVMVLADHQRRPLARAAKARAR